MQHEILLGLTTTPKSDWRGKIEEMKKFGIKKIALFPTFLEIEQRKELYSLLEQIEGLEIPHVHIRTDMDENEVEYLINRFGVEVLNTHPASRHHHVNDFSKFFSKLYVENTTHHLPTTEELQTHAGLCIDFSHWENAKRVMDSLYADFADLADRNTIGCCHVSAIVNVAAPRPIEQAIMGYDRHYLQQLADVDYLENYQQYLPKYISLELENSFAEQLEVKKYLEEKLGI